MLSGGPRCALPYRLLWLCCQLVSQGWRLHLLLWLLLLAQVATGAETPHGRHWRSRAQGAPKWRHQMEPGSQAAAAAAAGLC